MRLGAERGCEESDTIGGEGLGRPFSCGLKVKSAGRAWGEAGEKAATYPGQRGGPLSRGRPGLPLRVAGWGWLNTFRVAGWGWLDTFSPPRDLERWPEQEPSRGPGY